MNLLDYDEPGLGGWLSDRMGAPSHREATLVSGRVYDLGISWPWGARSTTQAIGRAVAGVGFHGHLPHGCHLAVCNLGARAMLDAMLTSGTRFCPAAAGTYGDSVNYNQTRPEEFSLLAPGDVVAFDEPRREGVYVALCCTETQVARLAASITGFAVRAPDPLIRLYPPGAVVPEQMRYTRVPWNHYHEAVETADPAAGAIPLADMIMIPDGTSQITISFWDDVAVASGTTHTPVQAGETGDFEVWFLMAGQPLGNMVHHEDDDFDAAGRGAVTPAHATETYAVPEGVVGVYVRRTSGSDDMYYSVVCSQTGRP